MDSLKTWAGRWVLTGMLHNLNSSDLGPSGLLSRLR